MYIALYDLSFIQKRNQQPPDVRETLSSQQQSLASSVATPGHSVKPQQTTSATDKLGKLWVESVSITRGILHAYTLYIVIKEFIFDKLPISQNRTWPVLIVP